MTRQWVSVAKRSVKVLVSSVFFLGASTTDWFRRVMGSQAPATYVVLYYHAVPARARERFARQMDTLVRLATPVPADSSRKLKPGKQYAAVTFDDGLFSVIENAIPALVSKKIPATLFIVAGRLGRDQNWAIFGAGYDKSDRLGTTEELRALPPDLITIGSHTISHPVLPCLAKDTAAEELSSSRRMLQTLLGRDIDLFSFPYGAFNNALIGMCRAAGYTRVFTTLPIRAHSDPNEFVTGRVSVDPTDWDLEFRLKLMGAYSWVPRVSALKRKLWGRFSPDSLGNAMSRQPMATDQVLEQAGLEPPRR
jgi:peptidoglycan/xylan/chitin deacetylase (PgdA/CDA1 family)